MGPARRNAQTLPQRRPPALQPRSTCPRPTIRVAPDDPDDRPVRVSRVDTRVAIRAAIRAVTSESAHLTLPRRRRTRCATSRPARASARSSCPSATPPPARNRPPARSAPRRATRRRDEGPWARRGRDSGFTGRMAARDSRHLRRSRPFARPGASSLSLSLVLYLPHRTCHPAAPPPTIRPSLSPAAPGGPAGAGPGRGCVTVAGIRSQGRRGGQAQPSRAIEPPPGTHVTGP